MKKAILISLVIGGWFGMTLMQQTMADTSVIGGGTLKNARGSIGLNIVAGNQNAQTNIASITFGAQTGNDVHIFQKVKSGFSAGDNLTALIEGQAFVGINGLTQANQISGSGNEEANTALIGIGSLHPMKSASLDQQHSLTVSHVIQEGGGWIKKDRYYRTGI